MITYGKGAFRKNTPETFKFPVILNKEYGSSAKKMEKDRKKSIGLLHDRQMINRSREEYSLDVLYLKEDHMLKIFESRILRRIFEFKADENDK